MLPRIVALALCLTCSAAWSETLTCGLKTVTVSGGNITQIKHEDGTVHSGGSISRNWDFDGKAIKHRLFGDPIPCGNKPKTRAEIIKELSSTFVKDPALHGMSKQEGQWMTDYTANLMRAGAKCHLLVTGAKSTSRKNMFYIDCNDKSAQSRRTWVSRDELKSGVAKSAMTPVSDSVAVAICNRELKARTTNPSSYDPSLILGTTSRQIEINGRNVVEIDFKTSNAFGAEGKYLGRCILEGGTPIEVTINQK